MLLILRAVYGQDYSFLRTRREGIRVFPVRSMYGVSSLIVTGG